MDGGKGCVGWEGGEGWRDGWLRCLDILVVLLFLVGLIGWVVGCSAWESRDGHVELRRFPGRGVPVGGFQVFDALLQVAEIVDAGLQDGQLVHLLVFAGWYHVLEDAKLFVHLRATSSFDEAMGGFPSNLLACCACRRWLFLAFWGGGARTFRRGRRNDGRRIGQTGFHLDDFARSRRRWWEGEITVHLFDFGLLHTQGSSALGSWCLVDR